MISPKTIDDVRDLPVEQVIGRYVDLKKSGSGYKACCPLHNEKTPSFNVVPAKNIFKCFGCGAGGDAIAFVMAHENLPFYEAVKSIAGQHGIEVEETGEAPTPEQKTEHENQLTALHQAQERYRNSLILNS
ncbi:MAG: CHC2 zinc finger domain-containing protein [Sphingobacteriia bacterium]